MFRYTVNPESDVPIYRQLVDQINAQIRSGALKTNTQLPTVREMAQNLHLSCGTVKRVYDCLQEMGVIEMTRRRGTFVKYVHETQDSRKIRAMRAIDVMIRQLSDLNFSPNEIQIFLDLKMREWGVKWSGLKLAVVTHHDELRPVLEQQIASLGNVRMTLCSPFQLQEYPYSVDERNAAILASSSDAEKLQSYLPDMSKLIRLAFEAAPESIVALAAVRQKKIGALGLTDSFLSLPRRYLPQKHQKNMVAVVPGDSLEELDVLVVPEGYQTLFDAATVAAVEAFAKEKKVIPFTYRIDAGSMLYLRERISTLRDALQLRPGGNTAF